MGMMYLSGEGVHCDERRGIGLLKLAAELGDEDAIKVLEG